MTDTRRRGMDLADYVHELTEPHSHVELYTVKQGTKWTPRRHVTQVPSLLTQLWQNDTPSQAAEDGPRPGYASRPAARIDAIDTAVRIDLEAAAWVRDLGEDDGSLDTAATIRQLHGLVASADPVQRTAITKSVRSWWIQARIVTGWDSAAWSPDATCPKCGERGTLKIRLGDEIGFCTGRNPSGEDCGATWDHTSIGVLGEHIKAESDEKKPREKAGPCWCPWPKPAIPDMSFQCRYCGTVACWHALRARLLASIRKQKSLLTKGRGCENQSGPRGAQTPARA